MKGFVNYYIEEPEENYTILRGDKDVYKFTLQPTEITLHDPTVPGETKLNFIEKGLTYTKFPTKVKDIGSALYDPETNSGLDSNQKELYEKELEEILKNNIDNVEEVIVFDHVIRSSKVAGTRHSPAIHVHGDYDHDKGIERIKNILGDEKSSQWFKDGEHENHVGIVNVWRPLDYPVEKCPLGHVDIDTIRKEDWKKVKIMYEHRVGNLTGLVHNDNHKWFVINQMSPDQVWIFCQFDNKTKICVPHSSVDVVGAKSDARPRKSIESRCLIRYKI